MLPRIRFDINESNFSASYSLLGTQENDKEISSQRRAISWKIRYFNGIDGYRSFYFFMMLLIERLIDIIIRKNNLKRASVTQNLFLDEHDCL